ncbi:hypothetical protein [Spirosoma radiotolerans]|uniref:hypothetical protein n=1 Tax=Spirosoma radiotolerans TaxID=1379870 RepID=UPI000B1EA344|nr:hypothetical protein [Spirosoma radiotolerans]
MSIWMSDYTAGLTANRLLMAKTRPCKWAKNQIRGHFHVMELAIGLSRSNLTT